MKDIIFGLTILGEVLLGGSLVLTLTIPHFRVWPPPNRNSWQFRYTWALTITSFLGILVLGVLDWNSFLIKHWLRFALGAVLMVSGSGFALWGVRTLSVHSTLGLEGQLVRGGPYKYSRNPQYVGDVVLLIGYALFTNSWMALVTGLAGAVWFLIAPFAEEPWLREQYGGEYERYVEQVPRFIRLSRKSDTD